LSEVVESAHDRRSAYVRRCITHPSKTQHTTGTIY
jgi:hypothetical protein